MQCLPRKLAAEGLGTALLLAAIVGSGIMADQLAHGMPALVLLCNALATGAILTVLITFLAPISGAHFNPAVTMAMVIRRDMSLATAFAYVAVQIVGAVLGTMLAHAMFAQPLLQASVIPRSGGGMWLAESVATFGLVLTILGTLRFRPDAVPSAVGLYIFSAYWFTSSTSFANPAVTLARTLTASVSGIAAEHAPAFILAQVLGAIVAAFFCRWLFACPPEVRAPSR
jgi:glycerol uptake facilitator-like aquaporin